jgi:hypothetical protein
MKKKRAYNIIKNIIIYKLRTFGLNEFGDLKKSHTRSWKQK